MSDNGKYDIDKIIDDFKRSSDEQNDTEAKKREPVNTDKDSAIRVNTGGGAEEKEVLLSGIAPSMQGHVADSFAVAAPAGIDTVTGASKDSRNLGRRFLDRILYFFYGIVPAVGDHPLEFIRKTVFVLALTTLIASSTFIINDLIVVPAKNKELYQSLAYDPDNPVKPPADYDGSYPEGIMEGMKGYYALNNDTRGFLRYSDTGKSWLDINYPVMYSDANDTDYYYLTHDFQHTKNKNGALFFDKINDLSTASNYNKNLLLHGHNMASGQMFAKLNTMLTNRSANHMKDATTIYLDTLFEQRQYQVFAVFVVNVRGQDGTPFNYLRNQFTDDADYMDFIANVQYRSLYDFSYMDVLPEDEIIMLSTCTAKSGAKIDDGRIVVAAKRVDFNYRVSEEDLGKIQLNSDALMPEAWYVNQGLTLPEYYTAQNFVVPNDWSATKTSDVNATTTTTEKTKSTTSKSATTTTAKRTTTSRKAGTTRPTVGDGTTKGTTTTKPTTTTAATTSTPTEPTTTTAPPAPTTEPPTDGTE